MRPNKLGSIHPTNGAKPDESPSLSATAEWPSQRPQVGRDIVPHGGPQNPRKARKDEPPRPKRPGSRQRQAPFVPGLEPASILQTFAGTLFGYILYQGLLENSNLVVNFLYYIPWFTSTGSQGLNSTKTIWCALSSVSSFSFPLSSTVMMYSIDYICIHLCRHLGRHAPS